MTQGALRLEIERHPAVNHIFLHRCATSPFSREDYRIFGENYFPLACLSPIHLERLVRRAPSPSERHALEELRSRDEDARALYERFLCAAKSSVPDALTARVPGPAYRFTRKVQRILAEEPFEVALGAVVPIFAWAVPRMFASLLAGLTRAGFSEEELRYFTREEPKGEVFSAALSAAQIRRGALLCLEAYGELWTGVQRAVVRYRQPRAARPDGARPRSALHEILLTAWDGLRAARLLEQKIIERQERARPTLAELLSS